jgi:8-oxo-dGTP diphosphatase
MDEIDEEAFLAEYDAGRYPRPSLAVDVVLLTVEEDRLRTLLVRRVVPPQLGRWALPGGFVGIDESLDGAAARALAAKAGLDGVFIEQLYTFGDPGRDPRTRVISVAYYALVDPAMLRAAVAVRGDEHSGLAEVVVSPDGTVEVRDERVTTLQLAFDHERILATAVERLRGKLDDAPIGFELLPELFTLRDLRVVHETILGRPLNKDSFRRRILDRGLVEPTGQRATGVGHRPPELYRFAQGPSRGRRH